ncbi:MAG: hypothetical protein DME65_14745 [Verrucomicrobia bacterium]|nr:MAG: hypothetical protein DME65_14745 [Verrucomicrobiota bacterium]
MPLSALQGNPEAIPERQATQPQKQAMLNRKVEKLQATVAQQQQELRMLMAQLKEQAALIQKVSAQLEINKPAARVVK